MTTCSPRCSKCVCRRLGAGRGAAAAAAGPAIPSSSLSLLAGSSSCCDCRCCFAALPLPLIVRVTKPASEVCFGSVSSSSSSMSSAPLRNENKRNACGYYKRKHNINYRNTNKEASEQANNKHRNKRTSQQQRRGFRARASMWPTRIESGSESQTQYRSDASATPP